ncbi:tRNA lysidine(34) synthetase TilS [Agaribacterium sp. ZY112]|uniref:tRNA lysidine(34) synthetase TilS n=1 Tax=Agaribacterium sp. ZY112 TaxID=3233574 RepID=UPI003523C91C
MQFEAHILQKLRACVSSGQRIWLALSGGLDSSVLLSYMAESEFHPHISAVYINHGLSEHAFRWQEHCEKCCEALAVPFVAHSVVLNKKKGGIEAAARQARYAVFESVLNNGDVLLTAHHQDDQVETVLQRFIRGAGLRGLAAMPEQRKLGRGLLIRPLLHCRRAELETWAKQRAIIWVDDESNDSLRFDRNYLRHQVSPLLNKRWPQASRNIAKTAANLRADLSLLQAYFDEDLARCDLRKERLGQSIALSEFNSFNEHRQQALIRHWLAEQGCSPETQALMQLANVIGANESANPVLRLGSFELRRFSQRLYCVPVLPLVDSGRVYSWDGVSPLNLSDGFCLYACVQEPMELKVSFRQSGERCQPVGRQHSQTLKKLLQEYKLEPWLRDRVPLISNKQGLVAVADVFMCEHPCGSTAQSFTWSYILST